MQLRSTLFPSEAKPPTNWIAALTTGASSRLIDRLYRPGRIETIDSLLMQMVNGDATAAIMLRHLLSWMPHSIRKDGAIWRSATQWQAQTGLTPSRINNKNRMQRLEAVGIVIFTDMAQGSNTRHYRLDHHAFTEAVANTIKTLTAIVQYATWDMPTYQQAKVVPFPAKSDSTAAQPDSTPAQSPLTDSTTDNTTEKETDNTTDNAPQAQESEESVILLDNGVIALLVKNGIPKKTAIQYADLPLAIVEECISDADLKEKAGEITASKASYLKGALKNQKKRHAETQAIASAFQQPGKPQVSPAQPAAPTPTTSKEPTMLDKSTPEATVWSTASLLLEGHLGMNSFNAYLYRSRCLGKDDDGNLLIEVRDSRAANMLSGRLARNVARALRDAAGEPVPVRFIPRIQDDIPSFMKGKSQ